MVNALAVHLGPEFAMALGLGHAPAVEGELLETNVTHFRLPLVRPIKPTVDVAALVATRRLIHALGPELVHTHMAKAGIIGRLAATTFAQPPFTVHTYHGHVLQGYFGRPQQRLFIELERRLARRTDVLVAVSPEVRDELLSLDIGHHAQYHVIPVGLDLTPFASATVSCGSLRARLRVSDRTPVIAIVGRLVPVKDHETLLQALRELANVHLAVIGDGELRVRLETRARALGLTDRVTFLGWISDLPHVLAGADVVVLSSRNEGTPLALIEAMAAGRPVVATAVGGVPHVVQHRETGLLCPPGNPGELAAAIGQLLNSPELAHQLAIEGRRRVVQRFGLRMMIEAHRDLYTQLLQHGGPRRRSAQER